MSLFTEYLKERIPFVRYTLLTTYLLVAGSSLWPVVKVEEFVIQFFTSAVFLIQMRIWDDWLSLPYDKIHTPQRVICRYHTSTIFKHSYQCLILLLIVCFLIASFVQLLMYLICIMFYTLGYYCIFNMQQSSWRLTVFQLLKYVWLVWMIASKPFTQVDTIPFIWFLFVGMVVYLVLLIREMVKSKWLFYIPSIFSLLLFFYLLGTNHVHT